VAVGLLTVLTYKDLEKELSGKGFELKDLDFLVCNCGSYIFCRDASGEFVADEAWEEKVSYRWDKKLVVRAALLLLVRAGYISTFSSFSVLDAATAAVAVVIVWVAARLFGLCAERAPPTQTRTLTRMQVNRAPSNAKAGGDKTSDVLVALETSDGVDANDGNGPLHVLMDLAPQKNSPLVKLDNATLIGKIRNRARRAGVRINLTLQARSRSYRRPGIRLQGWHGLNWTLH
jgi:hypothetical protein